MHIHTHTHKSTVTTTESPPSSTKPGAPHVKWPAIFLVDMSLKSTGPEGGGKPIPPKTLKHAHTHTRTTAKALARACFVAYTLLAETLPPCCPSLSLSLTLSFILTHPTYIHSHTPLNSFDHHLVMKEESKEERRRQRQEKRRQEQREAEKDNTK